jgi:hypothetical protein
MDEARARRSQGATNAAVVQEQMKKAPRKRGLKLPGDSSLDIDNFGEVQSAAAQVGTAQRGQPGRKKTPATGGNAGAPEVVVTEDSPAGKFKVEVKVSEINTQSQSNSVTPAGNVSP